MSRDDGFVVADVDVGLLDDDKVRRLWRNLGDHGRMVHALVLHEAVLLASWRQGRRVTVDEAAPVWLIVDESLVAELTRVRLLDRTRRVPAKSWEGWFGPARDRREARREAGRQAGIASGESRRNRGGNDRSTTVQRPRTIAEPDRSDRTGPSYPSDRTVLSRAGARGEASSNDAVESAAAAARRVAAGLRLEA